MSTQVNANVNLSVTGNEIGTAIQGISPTFAIQFPSIMAAQLTNGSAAAGKVNMCVPYTFTLASGANTTLNFNTLGTTDPVGGTVNITNLKFIWIQNVGLAGAPTPTEADSLTVEPGASDGLVTFLGTGSTLIIPGGGQAALLAPGAIGYAIVAATTMNIKFISNASANTITVNLLLIGSNA